MFIESFRQAHGQLKQADTASSQPRIIVTKEGNFYYIIGGLALLVSFFLPAIAHDGATYFPFQALKAPELYFKLLPLLYLLGLSTTLMVGTGRFRKAGIPSNVLVLHMLLSVGLILGTGVFFHLSLISSKARFGVTMTPFALLCWWPLFIRLLISWFWGKRPFLTRILSTTWISAACGGLIYLVVLLDVLYNKTHQVSYGLLVSSAATLLIMIGGIKNEKSSNRLLKT